MKKKYIRSAEGDYIKIGNRIIPTNTMDMGYADIDTISRRGKQMYDEDQRLAAEAERQSRLQAKRDALAQEYAAIEQDLENDLANATTSENKFNVYFNYFVPSSGNSDSVGGEIVRAMNKIIYRDWNDGDLFYTDYGVETCLPCVAYLCDNSGFEPIIQEFYDISERQLEDEAYTDALMDIVSDLVNYLQQNPELFMEPNETESVSYPTRNYSDMIVKYDFDFELPSKICQMLDKGIIDANDIIWDLEGWGLFNSADNLRIEFDTLYVDGLDSKNAMDEIQDWVRSNDFDTWADRMAEENDFYPDRDDPKFTAWYEGECIGRFDYVDDAIDTLKSRVETALNSGYDPNLEECYVENENTEEVEYSADTDYT